MKTPKELAAAIETEKELMHSRLQQVDSQIETVLGAKQAAKYPSITPKAQQALDKIDIGVHRLRTGNPRALPSAAVPESESLVTPGGLKFKVLP